MSPPDRPKGEEHRSAPHEGPPASPPGRPEGEEHRPAPHEGPSLSEPPRWAARLIAHHRPGAWIGSLRRAFGPLVESAADDDAAGVYDSRPPHYLIALWKPLRRDQPVLPRWPRKALLIAPDAAAATAELLREIPPGEPLWLTPQELDWGLVAEIVMLAESQLAPFQREALTRFVRDEREATLASVRRNYRGSQVFPGQYEKTSPGGLT